MFAGRSGVLLTSIWDELEEWLDSSGPDVLAIIATLTALYLAFRVVFPRVARAAIIRGAHPADDEIEKRADTIMAVVQRTAGVAFVVIGAVTILPELGVNITAIVTGLGITGLALALGAQALVRDAINGMFLLAEDQYRRGDVIKIAEVMGTVEDITLRRTIIRDQDGVVHSVPNGSIGVVSNYTRDYAQVNVPVRVAYGEDLDRVGSVVTTMGNQLAADPRFRALVVDMPRLTTVEDVGEGAITAIVTARVRPSARWDVAAEVRRRLAEAFVAEKVRVPFASVGLEDDSGDSAKEKG